MRYGEGALCSARAASETSEERAKRSAEEVPTIVKVFRKRIVNHSVEEMAQTAFCERSASSFGQGLVDFPADSPVAPCPSRLDALYRLPP